jgi:hypothetical protein
VRLLFGRERFTAELAWTDLTAGLPFPPRAAVALVGSEDGT